MHLQYNGIFPVSAVNVKIGGNFFYVLFVNTYIYFTKNLMGTKNEASKAVLNDACT